MDRLILLLRGVNVGGKNSLPMKELTRICVELGGQNVRTHLQSGNVALDLAPALAPNLADAMQRQFAAQLGLDVPVVTQNRLELLKVLARNPWPDRDPALLSVAFLAHPPTAAQIARLEPNRSPPDEFHVDGRVVYLHTPNGLGRTKLTNAWLDTRLATISTVRNWRTIGALAEL